MNNYYTYAYLREDRTPYYIGKGKGDRIVSTQRSIHKPTNKNKIIFLKQNLTEEEAFKHEIYMIAVFGRKDLGTGILRNMTNGGEGVSGYIVSEETRRKRSEANKGNTNSRGYKWTNEQKQNLIRAKKGKLLSESHKEALKKAWERRKLEKPMTDETRKKMSESLYKRWENKDYRERSKQFNTSKWETFCEEKKNEIREKIKNSKIGRQSVNCGEKNGRSKWWKIHFEDGKILEICGIANWAKENGYSCGHINSVMNGKRNKHKDIVAVQRLDTTT